MPLYNHLGPDQNVRLMVGKVSEDILIGILRPGRIVVHPKDPCLRKPLLHQHFDLLGSRLKAAQIFAAAGRAHLWHPLLIATVVADQPSSPMLTQ